MYGINEANRDIYRIDTTTGTAALFYDLPNLGPLMGLATLGDGIFYTFLMNMPAPGDTILIINTNTGFILKRTVPDRANGDLAVYNGEIYYIAKEPLGPPGWFNRGIAKLNLNDLGSSYMVINYGDHEFIGLSPTNMCNMFLIVDDFNNNEMFLFNIKDGVFHPWCESIAGMTSITSMYEFKPIECEVQVDLDCDDSSGATGYDYHGADISCKRRQAGLADDDIYFEFDTVIWTMTVHLTGYTPDGLLEFLDFSGTVYNVTIAGDSSHLITITNIALAKSRDFKEALSFIRYKNLAPYPTAGQRTIEIQFTTANDAISGVATVFLDVIELPFYEVDLGQDTVVCEGEVVVLDAGHPGANYTWSSGQTTQTVSTEYPGEYIVTVNSNEICAGFDTIQIETIPVIEVELDGDETVCGSEDAILTITTNSNIPLDVAIGSSTGFSELLEYVNGVEQFEVSPDTTTTYTIDNIYELYDVCVTLIDSVHVVEVYPEYYIDTAFTICEGDSLLIGWEWEKEAGIYDRAFYSEFGCDSNVTVILSTMPLPTKTIYATSCDSASTGIFHFLINATIGCDTQAVRTVVFADSDSTFHYLATCTAANTGTTIDSFINQLGCDSIVVSYYTLIPPQDTTFVQLTSCEGTDIGTTQFIVLNSEGCDSLVITNTILSSEADTTFLQSSSCDPADVGIFETLYNNQEGCDSLVISNVVPGEEDTTYQATTSCDSASLGVYEVLLQNNAGCDSLVIITVSYSPSDSTFQSSITCDETQAGIFISSFINRFGCDSIVRHEVSYVSHTETILFSETCNAASAGIFSDTLTGVQGCDSIIIETVELLPSDEIFLNETTCHSSQAGTFITVHFNQFGCDSIVTLSVVLSEVDSTVFEFFTCVPEEEQIITTIYPGTDGCDSLVIEQISLFPLPDLLIVSTADYNGFDISCRGAMDGGLSAQATGLGPFNYLWSTGDQEAILANLSSGTYAVTVTDANGCESESSITLTEPAAFSIDLEATEPDCFSQSEGAIGIIPHGGVQPILYSIDGVTFQGSALFEDLPEGLYEIKAIDGNGCTTEENFFIDVPIKVAVDLGDDQIIAPGDSVFLNASLNISIDSIGTLTWMGPDLINCNHCLTQMVAPSHSTTYSIAVTSLDGCSDEDQVRISVERKNAIYVPSIFSPNNDGNNDLVWIGAAHDIKLILSFVIFDKWGNHVFEKNDFVPNDDTLGWDGKFDGEELDPGVFAYYVIAVSGDGEQIVVFGDITLVK